MTNKNTGDTCAIVVVAGSTGDLAARIVQVLGKHGAQVRALVRARRPDAMRSAVRAAAVTLIDVDCE